MLVIAGGCHSLFVRALHPLRQEACLVANYSGPHMYPAVVAYIVVHVVEKAAEVKVEVDCSGLRVEKQDAESLHSVHMAWVVLAEGQVLDLGLEMGVRHVSHVQSAAIPPAEAGLEEGLVL